MVSAGIFLTIVIASTTIFTCCLFPPLTVPHLLSSLILILPINSSNHSLSFHLFSLYFFYYLTPTCLFSTLALCFPLSPWSPHFCAPHYSTLSLHLLSTHLIFYLLFSPSNLFCLCCLVPSPLISYPLISSFPLLLSSLLTSFTNPLTSFPPLLAGFLTAQNEE